MADVQVRDKLYINGAWVASTGSETVDVTNSTTEEVMGRNLVGAGDAAKVAASARGRRRP